MRSNPSRCAVVLMVLAGCGPKMHLVPPLAEGDPVPIAASADVQLGQDFWAISAGGPGPDGARLAVDNEGNTILAGEFHSTAYFGPRTLTAKAPDISSTFVAKIDPAGEFLWTVAAEAVCAYPAEPDVLILRTVGVLFGLVGLDVDHAGNIYVAAPFTGVGCLQGRSFGSKGATDLVVAKLSPSEGDVLWSRSAGGPGDDVPVALAVDAAGNVTVTGFFGGGATFGHKYLTAQGASDIFVARLDPAGNFVWAVQAGGGSPATGVEFGSAVALDAAGNAYVAGEFIGTATFGSHTLTTASPGRNGFLAKLDPSGTFLWATELASKPPWWGWVGGIALDSAGNSYLTGAVGQWTAAVAKHDPEGKQLWVRRATGTGSSWANGIVVDGAGSATVSAAFAGTAAFGDIQLTSEGNRDIGVLRFDAEGQAVAAAQAGGSRLDNTCGLAADPDGNLHVAGYFHDTATFGETALTSRGVVDVFVWKRPPL